MENSKIAKIVKQINLGLAYLRSNKKAYDREVIGSGKGTEKEWNMYHIEKAIRALTRYNVIVTEGGFVDFAMTQAEFDAKKEALDAGEIENYYSYSHAKILDCKFKVHSFGVETPTIIETPIVSMIETVSIIETPAIETVVSAIETPTVIETVAKKTIEIAAAIAAVKEMAAKQDVLPCFEIRLFRAGKEGYEVKNTFDTLLEWLICHSKFFRSYSSRSNRFLIDGMLYHVIETPIETPIIETPIIETVVETIEPPRTYTRKLKDGRTIVCKAPVRKPKTVVETVETPKTDKKAEKKAAFVAKLETWLSNNKAKLAKLTARGVKTRAKLVAKIARLVARLEGLK